MKNLKYGLTAIEAPIMTSSNIYETLLKEIIQNDFLDEEKLLEIKHRDIPLRTSLDETVNAYKSKSLKALIKGIVCSCIAKLSHPSWDNRKHQPQIGGDFSLRTIDSKVCKYLHAQGIYDSSTEYALTRSFEKAEAYTQAYGGKFKQTSHKKVFLDLIEFINETLHPEKYCRVMLLYLLHQLKKIKKEDECLKDTSILCGINEISLEHVSQLYEFFMTIKGKTSKIPPIMVYSCLQVCSPHLWPGSSVPPMESHTAADSHTGAVGDVMVKRGDLILLAAEVKDKIKVDEGVVNIFHHKLKDKHIPLQYILTTTKMSTQVHGNILTQTVEDFLLHTIQSTLCHNKNSCKEFLESFDKVIREDKGLAHELRTTIHQKITELLA